MVRVRNPSQEASFWFIRVGGRVERDESSLSRFWTTLTTGDVRMPFVPHGRNISAFVAQRMVTLLRHYLLQKVECAGLAALSQPEERLLADRRVHVGLDEIGEQMHDGWPTLPGSFCPQNKQGCPISCGEARGWFLRFAAKGGSARLPALSPLVCLSPTQVCEKAALHTSQSGEAGLVKSPELWRWSSSRDYWLGKQGK